MTDDKHDQLIERLTTIEIIGEDIKHRLFGNGQPGELAVIDERLGKLEQERWRLAVAGAAIMGIIQFFTGGGVLSLDRVIKTVQAMH